jgi:DNA-binding HxlR family transcriptional regulator
MLSGGARRFGELRRDIPQISPKMLTARLRDLEAKGVVSREVIASSPPSVEYSLTDVGHELIPVINAIVKVGTKLRDEPNQAEQRR